MSQTREERGLEIAKSDTITENADGSFSVPSQTVGEIAYRVVPLSGSYRCNCPDFIQRHEEVGECKHCHAVRFWIAARVELQGKPRPKVFADDALQCPMCGSIRVVKYGRANAKQVFKCRDCGRKFREGLIKKAKYSPETITLTLDLYFSGLSLRKIARTVNDHSDMTLTPMTIYRWIQRFVPQISEYVGSLTPQLSETWHADELFVSMKNGQKHRVGMSKDDKSIAYLWNVMDRRTRFLLASKLSRLRDAIGGERAFDEAIRNANGSLPETVFTDSLRAYNDAIGYSFKGEKIPKHIAKAGLRKHNATNNRIERLNGTLRERVKVQRGWKSFKTPIAEGARIHYNFVKPHQALEGQTPAQVAGIGIEARDKWMELLTNALGRAKRERA